MSASGSDDNHKPNISIKSIEQKIRDSKAIGDIPAQIDALDQLGDVYLDSRKKHLAVVSHSEALKLAKEIEDEGRTIRALFSLATTWAGFDETTKSVKYFDELMELLPKDSDFNRVLAASLRGHGQDNFREMKHNEAIEYYERAVKIAQSLSDDEFKAETHVELANCYYMLEERNSDRRVRYRHLYYHKTGDIETVKIAEANYLEAWTSYFHEHGPLDRRAFVAYQLGIIYTKLKQFEDAGQFYERALELYIDAKSPEFEQLALQGLASTHAALDNKERFIELTQRALTIRNEQSPPRKKRLFISSDSQRITAVHPEQGILQWQASDHKQAGAVSPFQGDTFAISRDGSLGAVYQNNTVSILQLPEGDVLQTINTPYKVKEIFLRGDSKVLATANLFEYQEKNHDYFEFVQFWNVENGRLIDSLELPIPAVIVFPTFSMADNWEQIVVGLGYESPYLWDRIRLYICPLNKEFPISDGGYNYIIKYQGSEISTTVFNNEATILASGLINDLEQINPYGKNTSHHAIHLWESGRKFPITLKTIIFLPPKIMLFLLLFIFSRGKIGISPPDSLAPRQKSPAGNPVLEQASRIFTGRREFRERKWLNHHKAKINWLAMTADSKLLVSGSDDHTIGLWHLSKGDFLQSLEQHNYPVTHGVLHPNRPLLATADSSGKLIFWQLTDGIPLNQQTVSEGEIDQLAASPDGRFLVTYATEAGLKMWDWNGNNIGNLPQTITSS